MGEELFELDLSELDSVAGGRALTERERRSQEEMRSLVIPVSQGRPYRRSRGIKQAVEGSL